MTRTSIRELVESWRPRYLKASRRQKTKILDEFVALTGYHRNSAIRLLRHGSYVRPRCASSSPYSLGSLRIHLLQAVGSLFP